jgi:hypothetical protein
MICHSLDYAYMLSRLCSLLFVMRRLYLFHIAEQRTLVPRWLAGCTYNVCIFSHIYSLVTLFIMCNDSMTVKLTLLVFLYLDIGFPGTNLYIIIFYLIIIRMKCSNFYGHKILDSSFYNFV